MMKPTEEPRMPGFRFVGIPARYVNHPLMNAAPYFTLPEQLLDQVIAKVGEDRFDADLLKMEYDLSRVCEDHGSRIGFWRREPINSQLLRPRNDLADDFVVQGMAKFGKTADEA